MERRDKKTVKSGVDDMHEGGGKSDEAGWHDETLLEAGSSDEGGFPGEVWSIGT